MDEVIKSLKENFLFQASLGSKELFHSNLLAWILEQKSNIKIINDLGYEENSSGFEALQIFGKKYLGISDFPLICNSEEIRIAREEKNIDLILKWKNHNKFNYAFIENKLKSIPTVEQLDKYDQTIKSYETGKATLVLNGEKQKIFRNKTNYRYLLTPLKSSLNYGNWKKITYRSEILSFLNSIKDIDFLDKEKSNINLVISTYINFIENLMLVLKEFNLAQENTSPFRQRPYDFYRPEVYNTLTDLRMHDLVLKLAHSYIESELISEFKSNNIEVNKFETAFTNSTGISSIDVEIVKNSSFYIGIQLQGNQFRFYLATSKSENIKLNEKLAIALFNSKIWFHDLENTSPLIGKGHRKDYYSKLGINSDSTSFCEYGKGGFIYLYKDVYKNNQMPTIDKIVKMFVSAFKHYEAKKPEIVRILNQVLK